MTAKTIEESTLEDVVGQLIADQAMIAMLLAMLKGQIEDARFDILKKVLDKSDSAEIREAFLNRVAFYQNVIEGRE